METPLLKSLAKDKYESLVLIGKQSSLQFVKHEYIKNVHLLAVILSFLFYSYGSSVNICRKQHIQVGSWVRCWELNTGDFRAFLNTKEGNYYPTSLTYLSLELFSQTSLTYFAEEARISL